MPENPPHRRPIDFRTRGRDGLQPEISHKLDVIREVYQKFAPMGYDVVFTAYQEWEGHALLSRHHTGYAVDVRTKDLPGGGTGKAAQEIAEELRKRLGGKYYVLLHKPPDPPHIHIEYRPGLRVTPQGDWNVPNTRKA